MKTTFCTPDTPKLTFEHFTEPQKYGDGKTFHEYRIAIRLGKRLVGCEVGPRRSTVTAKAGLSAARERIKVLQSHRLYAIRVTRKHIRDGEAHNCNTCALAQALWHNQERMGFSKYDFLFRVETYGWFSDTNGILLRPKYGPSEGLHIPVGELPLMTFQMKSDFRRGIATDGMAEWTMQWDEWAESRYMSLSEWREKHDHEPDERPMRPCPTSFVLDLDALKPLAEGAAK